MGPKYKYITIYKIQNKYWTMKWTPKKTVWDPENDTRWNTYTIMLNEMLNCITQAIINATKTSKDHKQETIKLLYDVFYHLET